MFGQGRRNGARAGGQEARRINAVTHRHFQGSGSAKKIFALSQRRAASLNLIGANSRSAQRIALARLNFDKLCGEKSGNGPAEHSDHDQRERHGVRISLVAELSSPKRRGMKTTGPVLRLAVQLSGACPIGPHSYKELPMAQGSHNRETAGPGSRGCARVGQEIARRFQWGWRLG